MSTAKFDTLQNVAGTKSVPVSTVVDGSAKAWVNFNGTGTVAIRASFNVSSITDNGTGDYTVNFTNAMTDANYVVGGAASSSAAATVRAMFECVSTTRTTSALRINTANYVSSEDVTFVSVVIFR